MNTQPKPIKEKVYAQAPVPASVLLPELISDHRCLAPYIIHFHGQEMVVFHTEYEIEEIADDYNLIYGSNPSLVDARITACWRELEQSDDAEYGPPIR